MKTSVVVFPGSNCDRDVQRAVSETLDTKVDMVWHEETDFPGTPDLVILPGGFSYGDYLRSGAMAARSPIMKAVRKHAESGRMMLGICNGFQALIKLGLVPYGEIRDLADDSPTLTHNQIGRHVSCMVETKVVSNLSPWFNNVKVGDIHTIAVSHGEGRFVADQEIIAKLRIRGQIATQYVDHAGNPSLTIPFNPNGSVQAIEGITSPDGRVLGKMGHSERIGENVCLNVPGNKDQQLFEAGIRYYK